MSFDRISIAILDYGMGNLFSICNACRAVGMEATITSSVSELRSAHAVILPGVGAFSRAMDALHNTGLGDALQGIVASGKTVVGICLGMQLVMEVSYEFGMHPGLGYCKGSVLPLEAPKENGRTLKVPHVGWTSIECPSLDMRPTGWNASPLAAVAPGSSMYFVHSFYVAPDDASVTLCRSRYGDIEFCSALTKDNLVAFQFHPERSGENGLRIYDGLKSIIKRN